MKRLLYLAVSFSISGCIVASSKEDGEKTEIRETGYLKCELSGTQCPDKFVCENATGDIDCIDLRSDCNKDNLCDCWGDSICGKNSECIQSHDVQGFTCLNKDESIPVSQIGNSDSNPRSDIQDEIWTDTSRLELFQPDLDHPIQTTSLSIRGPRVPNEEGRECNFESPPEGNGGQGARSSNGTLSIYNQSSDTVYIESIDIVSPMDLKWGLLDDFAMEIAFPIEIEPYSYARGRIEELFVVKYCGLSTERDIGYVEIHSSVNSQNPLVLPFVPRYYGPWVSVAISPEIKEVDELEDWNSLGEIGSIIKLGEVPLLIKEIKITPNEPSDTEWTVSTRLTPPVEIDNTTENFSNYIMINVQIKPYQTGLHSAVLEVHTNDPLAPITRLKVRAQTT